MIIFNIHTCSLRRHLSSGSIIYGRIMVDPQQSLGSAYHVSIEKIFVCSGLDGYIPQYSPDSGEYGCVADSELLSYRFKILVSVITRESLSVFIPLKPKMQANLKSTKFLNLWESNLIVFISCIYRTKRHFLCRFNCPKVN